MKILLVAAAACFVAPGIADAEIVDFTISGRVTGDRFADGRPGFGASQPALDAFLSSYSLGTAYTLSFSYDMATRPTGSYRGNGYYSSVPIAAVFSLGGATAALPSAGISVGNDMMAQRERFGLFGNATSPWVGQFAGFSPIDFAFEATSALPIGPALPGDIELAPNPSNYARIRFRRDDVGETGVMFSVDRIGRLVPAVPEPASWIMMIVGFGVTGGALRRRSARPAIA
jgi:hypothetical protein